VCGTMAQGIKIPASVHAPEIRRDHVRQRAEMAEAQFICGSNPGHSQSPEWMRREGLRILIFCSRFIIVHAGPGLARLPAAALNMHGSCCQVPGQGAVHWPS